MGRGGGRGRRGGRARSSAPVGRSGRGHGAGGDGGDRSSTSAGRGGRDHGGDGDGDGGNRSSSSAGRGERGRGRGFNGDSGDRPSSSAETARSGGHGHGREDHDDGGDRSSSSASQGGGRGDQPTESPNSSPSSATPPSVLGDPVAENYASKLKASSEEQAAHHFFNFLEQCKFGSCGDPVYVAEIKSMRSKGLWKLQVNFNHLRVFDRQLSHNVCNNRTSLWGWLLSAVRKFLITHCINKDNVTTVTDSIVRSDILANAKLEFMDIPTSIESLQSFVKRNSDRLSEFLEIRFEKGKAVLLPSDLGGHIFHSAVEHLIGRHILGHTWNGDFTISDWDIINGRDVVLMKRPVGVGFSPKSGAADLGKLDSELLPLYLKKDKDGKLVVPLYFHELDMDLKVLSMTITSEDLLWYREYMRSHPAYVPPMAHANLIRGLCREIRTFNLADDPLFKDLLTSPNESCYADWTVLITTTNSQALLKIYWYDIPEEKRKTTSKYDASLGSLLDFRRNSCEHIENTTRDKHGKQLMKRSIEAEVFPASKVLKFLPWLIKNLLKKCNMEGCFKDVWEVYKSSGFNYELGIRNRKARS